MFAISAAQGIDVGETATLPLKNRVGGSRAAASGRLLRSRLLSAKTATGSTGCGYETASGRHYFFSKDHLGSVREMTDATQAVVAEYAYDAFGNTTKTAGSMDSDFQYAGMQVLSPFPNLDWTHHRIYQTGMGRWLSRDPLGGNSPNPRDGAEILQGSNLYAYVGNTPTRWIDPLGLGWGFYFGIGFSGTSVGHGSGSGRSGMIGLNTYGQLWTSDSQTFFNDVDGGFWGFGLAITAGFQSTPNCPDSTSDGKASEAGLALGLGGEGGSASMDDSSLGLGHGYGPAVGLGLYQAQGPTVTHTGSTPPLWGGFQ